MKAFFELQGAAEIIIGTMVQERQQPQRISWQLRYSFELPSTDTLEQTIDYSKVTHHLQMQLESLQVFLMETLATKILDSLFAVFPLTSATLRLKKEATGALLEVSR